MEKTQTFTISELSKQFKIPASTLRYYEAMSLLPPVERNGKHRVYLQAHIDRLGAIQCFKQTGMSIKQIQTFFENEAIANNYDVLLEALFAQQNSIEKQLKQLKNNQNKIKSKINFYQQKKLAYLSQEKQPEWQ